MCWEINGHARFGSTPSRAVRSNGSVEPQLAAAKHALSRFGFAPKADVPASPLIWSQINVPLPCKRDHRAAPIN